MNKRILVGLFLLSAMPVSTFTAPSMRVKNLQNNAVFRNFCASYFGSILIGGGVGAATGSLINYLETGTKQYLKDKWDINAAPIGLLITLLCWAFESEVRNDIITGLQGDLDQYDITYKRVPMMRSAQIAAVLAYLGM